MATLPSSDIDAVHADVMREFSHVRTECPISKSDLRALIVLMDSQLATAETSTISAIPAGPGKTWLLGNASIARTVLIRTEQKRKDVL
jgi:hypothetical protein